MSRNPAIPLCFNFPKEEPDRYPKMFREYVDWGVTDFVICDTDAIRCIRNPEHITYLKKLCKEFGMRFPAMHAPYGKDYDMNIPRRREEMIQEHKRALEIAAEFGCTTYTIHIGAWHHVFEHLTLDKCRPLALQTLEALVPQAEKVGVVLAVENAFEKPNSAKEVRGLVTPFLSSPAIGVCYDTGHAHIMAPAPGKTLDGYNDYMRYENWWEGLEFEENALEKLQDLVVTCHIHDNEGYSDQHALPGYGTLDFKTLMPKLAACPRLTSYQTELCWDYGENWSGPLRAPFGGFSVKAQVEAYNKLFD